MGMRRVLRGGLIAVVAGGLVAAVAPAAPASPDGGVPARYANQKLDWHACPFEKEPGTREAQCALVTVPRDWADPGAGVDMQVSISRVAATGEPTGALLTNPGGPGGQGTSLAGVLAGVEPALNRHYDVIGMDPRGTGVEGGGQAGYQCKIPTARLPKTTNVDARDRSSRSIRDHLTFSRAVAEACQSDALAPYITTWQTTHDMNLIRHLLGQPKLNYLGYSYGTWLGAKYASLFPERTGRMVLDSSVNWQGRLQADFEDFPRMDQRQFDRVYLPWAARRYPKILGPTARQAKQAYERARTFYATQGVAPDVFDSQFVGNGSAAAWPTSLMALVGGVTDSDRQLQRALAGAPQPLRSRLDAAARSEFGVPAGALTRQRMVASNLGQDDRPPDYVTLPGTRYAVACGDQHTRSTRYYKRLSDRQGPRWPLYGWAYGLGEVCGPWTDAPQHALPTMPRGVQDKVLVVQGEFDPQTSYEQATAAARRAPGASVLRVDDAAFHGQYAIRGNPCVDGVVNTYLQFGSKTDDSLCPAIPLPGEQQVYPVAGPLDKHPQRATARAALGSTQLREGLDRRVADVNAPHRP